MTKNDFEKIYGQSVEYMITNGHEFSDPEVLKIKIQQCTVAHLTVFLNEQYINNRSILLTEATMRNLYFKKIAIRAFK